MKTPKKTKISGASGRPVPPVIPHRKSICVLVHTHEYGASVYPFREGRRRTRWLDASAIARQLKVDYEPDKGENLEICDFDLNDIPTIQ